MVSSLGPACLIFLQPQAWIKLQGMPCALSRGNQKWNLVCSEMGKHQHSSSHIEKQHNAQNPGKWGLD